ncbi:CPBP family intramembrane metalloprotease [Phocaeicola barnesiae]|jgi:membrane protease YdiL (CAAX protease family)|uniref:CPBP family intramembrane glutamic endopeptidase n=1 Tax=Phocaeicola barnesiae TaxID=376804 RepID=UPI001F2A0585|nr:CPBP family intramembrane glutamic endopeptidase [Phocaeicola barnesiae]MCF2577081.1 CPBP family intramembrane metalloprotease [Phocaeicola barnesiae]MDM8254283.1 CPBP family intramembrane metalloprotease [Phocaeicola barnesiae]MDM8308386.1 CPBP family intramembrane metalloprotease [Phocaeicola barnesiae]
MGRTIKLLLYFFAYQLAFMGVFICGYMIHKGVFEVPQTPDSTYTSLILLAQVLSTAAMGIHLLVGKYVPLDRKTWSYCSSSKVLIASVVFILALGLWTNYLSELADLPNSMQETFEMMMRHPLGIIAIVIMAPIVEELLFRGAIEGHLLRKWKHPAGAIVFSSLVFGVVHGNWVQAPFAFVIGLALGWMYYRTGSLLPGILMHFVNNSTAVLGFLITDNPDATMVSEYGPQGAAWMAVAGAVVTVLCVYLFQKKLVAQPAVWHEIEEVESQNDENVFIQNK